MSTGIEMMEPQPAAIPAGAHDIVRYAQAQADQVNAIVISDRSHFQLESQRLRDVMTAKKNLEEMRLSATGPLNQALLAINSWFRSPREQLEKIERVIKGALGVFQAAEQAKVEAERREAIRKAQEEQAELQRRADAAAARGRSERAAELAARAEAVVVKEPEVLAPKARGMGFGTEWVYEVEDEARIPREYLQIDHAAIRAVVNGLKDKAVIPGVKIWSRPKVSAQGNRR